MPTNEPYRAPSAAVEPPPAPPTRQRDGWVVRIAFGLLLCLAVVLALSPQPEDRSAEDWIALRVGAAGVAVACVGLLVPWARLGRRGRALHPPQRQLAAVSRFVGWFALGLLPVVALRAHWWVNPLVAVLPFAALALWRRRPWAAWIWYAVAALALAGGLWRLWSVVTGFASGADAPPGTTSGSLTSALVLLALAVVVARDTRAFQRSLRHP